jgi:hypothetical protein
MRLAESKDMSKHVWEVPMRHNTQSVTIDATPKAVREFVADPANLPRWAVGFAKTVRQGDDGRWIVETAAGDMPIDIESHADTGVVDFHMQPAPGVRNTAYSRAVAAGDGALYSFTQLQSADMADEVFEANIAAVHHELVALKAILEVECPIGR